MRLYPFSALFLLVLISTFSCKKIDLKIKEDFSAINLNKFFALPADASSETVRVTAELKNMENQSPGVINKIISQAGYPVWAKVINQTRVKKNTHAGSNALTEEENVLIIPMALEEQDIITAYMEAVVMEADVNLTLFKGTKYQILPLEIEIAPIAIDTILSEEKFALQLMYLDYTVYGHTVFKINDKRLFNGSNNYSDTANIKRSIILHPNESSKGNSNIIFPNSYVTICVDIITTTSSYHCTHSGKCLSGTCDGCYLCVSYSTSTRSICDGWWEEGGGGAGDGTADGGSGGGGGSDGGCTYGRMAISPCDGGGGDGSGGGSIGWEPIPSDEEANIFEKIQSPIDVADAPILEDKYEIKDVLSPTSPVHRRIAYTKSRNNTEDLLSETAGDDNGILSYLRDKNNTLLEENMDDLFYWCTYFDNDLREVGTQMMKKFFNKSGGEYSNAILNDKISHSSALINFLKSFGKELDNKIAAAGNISQVQEFELRSRPIFNGTYNKFHGLQILINDIENADIQLDDFQTTLDGKNIATVTVTIFDHFGLDKNDAINYQNWHNGFASWWILQHKRGYVPFITKIVVQKKIEWYP